MTPRVLAIVGAGPTATSFLERFVASSAELLGDEPVEVHLVDPHPAGGGRVWRHDQSALLRMNSMAEDVTMFTDASVRCEGPIRPGPALDEWAALMAADGLATPELTAEVRETTGTTFPTRRLQNAYLSWVFDRVVAEAPPNVAVIVHADRVSEVRGSEEGPQELVLEGRAEPLVADVVVLAIGHIDVDAAGEHLELARFARDHGLYYLPPAYSADIDLSGLTAEDTVVMRGFGLAFIDLAVLLTEGRGGTYHERADGELDYHPSGAEPRIWVGSRRGVPYRSKIGYHFGGGPPQLPRFLTTEAVDELIASHERLDFRAHVWPLLAKEIAWGYYQELFTAHPERTSLAYDEFAARYAEGAWGSPGHVALIEQAVPDVEDRIDFEALDRPLAGERFASLDALQDRLVGHIRRDLARRADPAYSADLGAFTAFLSCFRQVPRVAHSGKLGTRSRLQDLDGWWFGFFSYFASGPPPFRLRELLALHRAGLVKFLGAEMWVEADEATGRFRAGSASVDEVIEATALVESRLPRIDVRWAPDPLVSTLLAAGSVTVDELVDHDGTRHPTGRLQVSRELQVLDRAARAQPRRFALGAHTSRPAAGAFSRPRTNAPSFRQNDTVARAILTLLAGLGAEARGAAHAEHDEPLGPRPQYASS